MVAPQCTNWPEKAFASLDQLLDERNHRRADDLGPLAQQFQIDMLDFRLRGNLVSRRGGNDSEARLDAGQGRCFDIEIDGDAGLIEENPAHRLGAEEISQNH